MSRIATAEAWLCPMPLPFPLQLGPMRYETRDYVVLRLVSDDGLSGSAIGYTRGTPLHQALRTLCGHLHEFNGRNHDPGAGIEPGHVLRALRARLAPGWASFVRAASLVDLALHDIHGQEEGLPVGVLLGGTLRDVPLMGVVGYFADQRPFEELVAEAERYIEAGYDRLKVMIDGTDAGRDARLVAAVRAAVPERIGVGIDCHGVFTSSGTAREYLARVIPSGAAFVEDPFPSGDTTILRDFVVASKTPVAAGEDTVHPDAFGDLIDLGVRFLRVDATASGGLTGVLAGLRLTEAAGATVLPHVWPHVHGQLAALSNAVTHVEVIPPFVGADPFWSLLADSRPPRGAWAPSEEPGSDLRLDFGAVAAAASQSWTMNLGGGS